MRVSYIAPEICMLKLNPTNRNAGYCCTGSAGMSVLVHPASVHVCSTFSRPAAQASLPQGQQTHLLFRLFDDYVALDQHTCLRPSNYVCNSVTRLAGIFSILF